MKGLNSPLNVDSPFTIHHQNSQNCIVIVQYSLNFGSLHKNLLQFADVTLAKVRIRSLLLICERQSQIMANKNAAMPHFHSCKSHPRLPTTYHALGGASHFVGEDSPSTIPCNGSKGKG